tara:strand:- start:40100 stop:45235 length:5136 start_codon:yes stop_codon:yes gene_type:complete
MPQNKPLTDTERDLLMAGGGYGSIQQAINQNESSLSTQAQGNIDPYALGKGTPYPAQSLGYETFFPKTAYGRLGFSPFIDNHDKYKQGTSKWEDFLDAQNASTQMMTGMTSFFGAGGGDQSTYTAARDYEKLVDMGSPVGKTDNFSWALKQYVQAGYTKAIITSIVAEELALAAVTAASRGKTAALAWGKTVKNANRLIHIGDKLGDAKKFEDLYDVSRMAKQTDNARKTIDGIQDVSKARTFWEASRKMASQAGNNIAKGTRWTAGKVFPHAGSYINSVKRGEYAMNGFAGATAAFGAFWREHREFKLAFEEADLEKAFIQKDAMAQLVGRFRDENEGKNPEGKSLENLQELAEGAGASGKLTNSILIYATNKFGFNSLFTRMAPRLASESIKASRYGKLFVNKAKLKNGNIASADFVPKGTGIKGSLGISQMKYHLANLKKSPVRTLKYLAGASAMGATEGTQEYFQEVIQDAEITRAVKSYGKSLDGGWLDYHATSMQKYLSPQGAEVFASGFFMGAFAGPHKFMMNRGADAAHAGASYLSGNYKKNQKTAEDMQKRYASQIDKINDMLKNPWSKEVGLGALMRKRKQTEQTVEQDQAVEDGDENTFNHIVDDQTLETIYNALDKNVFETLLEQVEQIDQLTDGDILEAFSEVIGENASSEDVLEFKKNARNVIDNARYIEKIKKDTDNRYINPYRYGVGEKGDDTTFGVNPYFMHNAFEYTKKQIVKQHYSYKRTLDRQDEYLKAMMDNPPFWDKTKKGPASEITILFNESDLANEVSILKTELEVANNTSKSDMTAGQKRDLKFMQDKYDLLAGYTKDVASKEEIPWKDGTIIEVDGKFYKQVTSPTEDIGKYYDEVDKDGNPIKGKGTTATKKDWVENKIRKGKKGTKEKVEGIQKVLADLKFEYLKDKLNENLSADYKKKIEEGEIEATLGIGMPVDMSTKKGGKGIIIGITGNYFKIKPNDGTTTVRVLKSNVSLDKDAAFDMLYKKKALEVNTQSVVDKLYKLYSEYMKLIAKKNNNHVDEVALDKSFQKLLDFYGLEKDAENLTNLLNLLMNPKGFEASLRRKAAVEEHLWKEQKTIIAESLQAAYENAELNFFLQELASKHNAFMLEESVLQIQNPNFTLVDLRTMDITFYDKTNTKPIDKVSERHQSSKAELKEYLDKRWKKEDEARTEYKVGANIKASDIVDNQEVVDKIKVAKKVTLATMPVDNVAEINIDDELIQVTLKPIVKPKVDKKPSESDTKKTTEVAKEITLDMPFETWDNEELKTKVKNIFDDFIQGMSERDDADTPGVKKILNSSIDDWISSDIGKGKVSSIINEYNASIKKTDPVKTPPVNIKPNTPPESSLTKLDHPIAKLELPLDIINGIISGKIKLISIGLNLSDTSSILEALKTRNPAIKSMVDSVGTDSVVVVQVKDETGTEYDIVLSYKGKQTAKAADSNILDLAIKLGLPQSPQGIYKYSVKLNDEITFYASSEDQAKWLQGSGSQNVFAVRAQESYQEPTKNEEEEIDNWVAEITERFKNVNTVSELDDVKTQVIIENEDTGRTINLEASAIDELYKNAFENLSIDPLDLTVGDTYKMSDTLRKSGITGQLIIGVVAGVSNDSVTFTFPLSNDKQVVILKQNLGKMIQEKLNPEQITDELAKKENELTKEEKEAAAESKVVADEIMDDEGIKRTLDEAEKKTLDDVRNNFWDDSITENCP